MWGLFLFLPFPIVRLGQVFEIGFMEIVWDKNDSLPKNLLFFSMKSEVQNSSNPGFSFFLENEILSLII